MLPTMKGDTKNSNQPPGGEKKRSCTSSFVWPVLPSTHSFGRPSLSLYRPCRICDQPSLSHPTVPICQLTCAGSKDGTQGFFFVVPPKKDKKRTRPSRLSMTSRGARKKICKRKARDGVSFWLGGRRTGGSIVVLPWEGWGGCDGMGWKKKEEGLALAAAQTQRSQLLTENT